MCEMTGHTNPHNRQHQWGEQRVFFLTPHVLLNDINGGNPFFIGDLIFGGSCPAGSIVCIVIDEAHKSQGKYQYVQVVHALARRTRHFRVLALSASPGGDLIFSSVVKLKADIKAIQNVVTNLLIDRIEVRTENNDSVRQYIHTKDIEVIRVRCLTNYV